ncbi:hypothetical protein SS50377_25276 [Spironucleus salmonicida]|uniref:Uncharacterized protein n=1 Tax=Spironucleus salmonicida TaxID=348837 RepID=V6LC82_9EUKA|nr:hypothetical protein SS50377_25276 [Spironucleus salmonicida]|eukprot:EST41843.1 Hypothetical protein SS50377_18677 [Spironucleus salmonicida]
MRKKVIPQQSSLQQAIVEANTKIEETAEQIQQIVAQRQALEKQRTAQLAENSLLQQKLQDLDAEVTSLERELDLENKVDTEDTKDVEIELARLEKIELEQNKEIVALMEELRSETDVGSRLREEIVQQFNILQNKFSK